MAVASWGFKLTIVQLYGERFSCSMISCSKGFIIILPQGNDTAIMFYCQMAPGITRNINKFCESFFLSWEASG